MEEQFTICQNPKISIIVPVYKVEQYLRRCLDSIAAQTFTDWECILIDDGSPDASGKICDEYAECDGRFRVIHQENKGVSAARNAGLDAAQGEWIGFVDSDDWVEKEYLSDLYTGFLGSPSADISICNIIDEFDKQSLLVAEEYSTNANENIRELLLQDTRGGPWAFIVKKSTVKRNNLLFNDELFFWEDFLFKLCLYASSKKLVQVHKFLYHYNRINFDSATSKISSEKCLSMLNAVQESMAFLVLKKLYEENSEAMIYRLLWTKLFYVKSLPASKRCYDRIFYESEKKIILSRNNRYIARFNAQNILLLWLIAKKHYLCANCLINMNNFFRRPYSK